MTPVKLTLPLVATMLLMQSAAIAGPSAALDPYAYISAPTKEERELMLAKKQKKARVAKGKKTVAVKPAKTKETKPEESPAPETAANEPQASSADGNKLVNGFKSISSKLVGSDSLIGKSTKSIGQGFVSAGEKVKEGSGGVGGKVANGFKSAGGKIVGGTQALGQGMVKTASKVGSSSGETVKKLATAPAAGFGAIGQGMNKLNPFHNKAEIANKGKGAQPNGKNEADRLVYPESTAATQSAIPQ